MKLNTRTIAMNAVSYVHGSCHGLYFEFTNTWLSVHEYIGLEMPATSTS